MESRFEAPVPLQKGAIAMCLRGHSAGRAVLLINSNETGDKWYVVTKRGAKWVVPSSHLLMIEGYEGKPDFADRLAIDVYKKMAK
jgi:hypothetical protein